MLTQPSKVIEIRPVQIHRQIDSTFQQNEKDSLKEQVQKYKKELAYLKKEKERLLQQTEEEIQQKKEQWENEREKIIEEAKEEGFHKGISIGKQEGKNHYESLLKKANEFIGKTKEDYYATIEQSEEKIIALAIHAAEKIIQQKIDEEADTFLSIVKAALRDIKEQPEIFIYLHPKNYEAVYEKRTELMQIIEGDAQLSLYVDTNIRENDCIIEHPFGKIDASVDTQLTEIYQSLKDFVEQKKK